MSLETIRYYRWLELMKTVLQALQLAFEQGARWADKHPRKHYRHETNNL